MVKKQQHKTSSSSTSAQIRKPAVTTRSRRSQDTVELAYIRSTEQQKKFAFEMKRKRKSDIESGTPGEEGGIDRQSSPNNTDNALVIQNSDSKLGNTVSSPSKRAKLLTSVEHNNDDEDIMQDVIQTNVESSLKNNSTQNGVESRGGVRDNVQLNSVHNEPLINGNMVKNSIKNVGITADIAKNENKDDKQEVQSSCKIVQENVRNDFVHDIGMIIDSFKDVIEIRGTQMVIGNYVVEYDDYQKFMTLLNTLMDTLEKNDSEKLLQSAKKIGYKENTGQVLNLKLFRAKISKRAYKSLNEFQGDFTCTCNDAIAANPEKHDIGVQFLKLGAQLFEQAYKELPNGIRRLDNCEIVDAAKGKNTKRPQKIALIQPTLDGHVFSSVAIEQPETNVFKLVGELQDMAVVSSQSMDKKEIPTIGSILPKKKKRELPLYEERKLPGVKFHKYKAYASFAPIYDSSAAMLSYEDTVLTCAYKKHSRASKNINGSDLSEKEDVIMVSEEVSQKEGSEIASTSKQNNSENDIFIGNNNTDEKNEKLFEDIDVDLLYKRFNEETKIDQILDENVEIFKNVQSMQEKRLTKSNPNIISAKERELAIKLQNKLADIISEVSPADLVSFDSIENAMDNLPIKEKSFKGMLPPDKSFAYPTNVVSRDAFGRLSRVGKSSEDRKDANVPKTQKKPEEALPQVSRQVLAGPSRSAPHQIRQQPQSQSLHHPLPHASMTYPRPSRVQPSRATHPPSRVQPPRATNPSRASAPIRMPYGGSQSMSTPMHASYQMTYPRPLSAPSRVSPYYPSQRYPPPYAYYPQYGYSMGNSAWQQRPRYH